MTTHVPDKAERPRVQSPPIDQMTDEQRELYEEIIGGPRSSGQQLFKIVDGDGTLLGPFGNLLHAPSIGHALQDLGVQIRYQSSLSDRAREIAILTVGAHWSSAYEAYAHEAVGRAAGLSESDLAAIASGEEPPGADEMERATWQMTTSVLAGDVDDATWANCVPPLSARQVVELTTLTGYYGTLALQMRVFRNDIIP